eukprot:CFRG1870T1
MTGQFGRFRLFLKSLGPGEAGFVNACVGLTAFSLAFYRHQLDIRDQKEREAEQDAELTFSIVNKIKPGAILQTMKRYRSRLRLETREIGIDNPTRSELTDEWLRRRNVGDPDAENLNVLRLEIKAMLRACVNFIEHHPDKKTHITGLSTTNPIGSAPVSEQEFRKVLLFVEPLDKACCKNHPTCNWDEDKPPEYDFLRTVYNIPIDWPSEQQNEDDFSPGAIPEDDPKYIRISDKIPATRVAQRFNALDNLKKAESNVAIRRKFLDALLTMPSSPNPIQDVDAVEYQAITDK